MIEQIITAIIVIGLAVGLAFLFRGPRDPRGFA